MAGIRVNTPKGDGWSYSLDQQTWQNSRVFMTQADGSPFVLGVRYPVYCRNLTQQLKAVDSIVYGLPTNDDAIPVSLDSALQNGANSQIVPLFEGGLAAILPADPVGSDFPEVVVGPDGTFYYKGEEAPSTVLRVVSVDELYSLVADTVESLPDYMLRLDYNTCGATAQQGGELTGWVADLNHLDSPASVRIERDGSIVGTLQATEPRPDVRTYLATLGYFTANVIFGYKHQKSLSSSDGKEHDWQVYGGTSDTRAISDTGALNKITCGQAATVPPTLANPQPDVPVTTAGDYSFPLIDNEFTTSNPGDTVTRTPYYYDGGTNTISALPLGVTWSPITQRITVAASFANRAFVIRVMGVNSTNQSTPDDFLLSVNRPAAQVTLQSVSITGPVQVVDNSSTQYQAIAHYSDGTTQNVTAQAGWGISGARKLGGAVTPAPVTGTDGGLLSIYMGQLDHFTVLIDLAAEYQGKSGLLTVTAIDDLTN